MLYTALGSAVKKKRGGNKLNLELFSNLDWCTIGLGQKNLLTGANGLFWTILDSIFDPFVQIFIPCCIYWLTIETPLGSRVLCVRLVNEGSVEVRGHCRWCLLSVILNTIYRKKGRKSQWLFFFNSSSLQCPSRSMRVHNQRIKE